MQYIGISANGIFSELEEYHFFKRWTFILLCAFSHTFTSLWTFSYNSQAGKQHGPARETVFLPQDKVDLKSPRRVYPKLPTVRHLTVSTHTYVKHALVLLCIHCCLFK